MVIEKEMLLLTHTELHFVEEVEGPVAKECMEAQFSDLGNKFGEDDGVIRQAVLNEQLDVCFLLFK